MNTNVTSDFDFLRKAMLDQFPGAKITMQHWDRYHPVLLGDRCPVEQIGLMLQINGKVHGIRFHIERQGDDGKPYKIDFEEEFERQKIIRECVHVFIPMKDGKPPKPLCYLGIL